MPIPFLLAGAGVLLGTLGVAGHSCAKDTNEKAQKIAREAEKSYNDVKEMLEYNKNKTETELYILGRTKKRILDTTMEQFFYYYEKIKEVQRPMSQNEVFKYMIDEKDVFELKSMSNIYDSAIASGASGAATGAIVALAASGVLPIVGSELALAGSVFAAGELGLAAGLAGSALSFGTMMTPLSAVVAPVVFFTALSASMKADENLEKAEVMHEEAEAAKAKMNISITILMNVREKAEMFNELLINLNDIFYECNKAFCDMVKRKEVELNKESFTSKDFSDEEMELIGVTRSLAGAISAVVKKPILNEKGKLSEDLDKTFYGVRGAIPNFSTKTKSAISGVRVEKM